ncbi:MAG: antibiotic biosynthesis monooxygenase family protein [Gaiellaceae bacterium]
MLVLVFTYDAREPEEFEQIYGPEGEWAQFFRSGAGYIGTELLRDVEIDRRYVVIDRWDSVEAYGAFTPSTAWSTCAASTTPRSTSTRSCGSARSRTSGESPAAPRPRLLGVRRRPRRHPPAAA